MTPAPVVLMIFLMNVGIIHVINKERKQNLNEAFIAELRVLDFEYKLQNETNPDLIYQGDIDSIVFWQETQEFEKKEAFWMSIVMALLALPAFFLLFGLVFMTS